MMNFSEVNHGSQKIAGCSNLAKLQCYGITLYLTTLCTKPWFVKILRYSARTHTTLAPTLMIEGVLNV
jgi:hypothetical protein